jgi:ribosomal protein S18 acetylase RimI-like enzyme
VATVGGRIRGLYILHPNNIGRCGHVANASFAVAGASRGEGIGRLLVEDCLRQAAACGFRGLQFNAVVASNERARALYESLGFARIGMIPGGFRNKDDVYEDMYIYYHPTE